MATSGGENSLGLGKANGSPIIPQSIEPQTSMNNRAFPSPIGGNNVLLI